MANQPVKRDEVSGTETTGHEWDGIEELNSPMPRWWLWTFYATIVWGVIYTVLYPAWPMVNSATAGIWGYSTRGEVAGAIAEARQAQSGMTARIEETELAAIGDDEELHRFANAGGAATFRTFCAQCHGSGAAGAPGYPNLLDDAWIWGGDIDAIHQTIAYGIRSDHDETRLSEMPAFGRDGILGKEEIAQVAEYVLSLSGADHDAALAEAGGPLFADNCSGCHGEAGEGMVEMGAPNLSDAIWLYGGDRDTLVETITNSRAGVMPAWTGRLTDAQIKQVSVYVHGLGGGQ